MHKELKFETLSIIIGIPLNIPSIINLNEINEQYFFIKNHIVHWSKSYRPRLCQHSMVSQKCFKQMQVNINLAVNLKKTQRNLNNMDRWHKPVTC